MHSDLKKIIGTLGIILVLLTTYAYSALSTSLTFVGDAVFRAVTDIRITDITFNNATTGASIGYESTHKKDTITSGFKLTSSSASMTYKVTITNSGTVDYVIYNILNQSSNNAGLTYTLKDSNNNVITLPYKVGYQESKDIYITYQTSSPGNSVINIVNKFDFRQVHYVTYNLKSGTSSNSDLVNGQSKYENVDLTLTSATPTRSGYDFLGWTDEQNGTVVKFSPGDVYTLDQNMILYAIWAQSGYTITYNPQNGEQSTQDVVIAGNALTTLPTPTKTGYTLLGWFTDPTNGTQISASTVPTGDITYYAHWTPVVYNITYNLKNGTVSGENPNPTTYTIEDNDILLNNPTKEGYTFDGWTSSSVQTPTKVYTITQGTTGDLTIEANYTPFTYNLIVNANGGTYTGTTPRTLTYDSKNNNQIGTATKTGYTFVGWNTAADGSGVAMYDASGNNMKSGTNANHDNYWNAAYNSGVLKYLATNNSNITVYAQFIADTYNAFYDQAIGDGSTSSKQITYNSTYGTLTQPTREGYTFDGWYNTADRDVLRIAARNTTHNYQRIARVMPGNTYTLNIGNAKLIEGAATGYTLFTHNATKNTGINGVSKNFNTSTTYTTTIPSDWSDSDQIYILVYSGIAGQTTNVGTEYTNITMSYETEKEYISSTVVDTTSNVVLYAHWTPNDYTVTFNPNGGNVTPTSKSVTYDSAYGPLPEPSKTGYTFEGWKNTMFPDSDLINSLNWQSNQDVTVTKTSDYVQVIYNQNWSTPGYIIRNQKNLFEVGKKYTVTALVKGINLNQLSLGVCGDTISFSNISTTEFTTVSNTFTYTKNNQDFILLYNVEPTIGTGFQIKYLQIQEGETSIDYDVETTTIVKTASNHTLYAQYTPNELTFNNKSSSITYNASNTSSIAIDGASNGTGTYTYSKVSESNGTSATTYFSVSGTNVVAAANTPVGTYSVVVKATDSNSGATKNATYTITVNRQGISVPSCGTFTYNRQSQTFLNNTTSYTVTDNTGTNAGDYTVKVTPTSNYKWSIDDTTTVKNVSCTINPYNISGSNSTVVVTPDKTYNGSAFEPTPTVSVPLPNSINSYTLTSSDITYSYSNNINAGTATITITGKGNYTGTKTDNFTINKATGYVTLNKTSENVEYSTASATFKVLTNSGTLSVSDNNATATVAIVGDTVTVSDISTLSTGTSVVVTVTSAATNNYTQATATYTLNITNKPLTGGSVVVTGNNIVGNTLTASVTDTTPAGTYTYQWYRGTSPISGATSSTYTLTSSDAGNKIKVVVTASKANYEGTSFEDSTDTTNNKTENTKTGVSKPTNAICNSNTYTGETITPLASIPSADSLKYGLLNNSGVNAGNYTLTARLNDGYIWSNGDTTDVTFTCSISKSNTTTTLSAQNKTYNGDNQVASGATAKLNSNNTSITSPTITYTYYSGTSCTGTALSSAPKNYGTYRVVATLSGTDNYNSSSSECTAYTMAKKSVAVSWTNVGPFTYNGSNQGPTATVDTGITGETMSVNATKASTAGTHTSTATCTSVTSSSCDNYNLTSNTKQFTINAQSVNPVTNLSVNTNGVVSWTASSNATGYQISIDGTNWTDMPSSQTSYNYLNVLTATSANKTVYVRAINTDKDNYSTVDTGSSYAHSSNATSAVTIRTLTVSSNNTNYGTVNNTSFYVINGATYSASSNVLTLSDGRTSTATKIDVVGYTTTFSSWSPASGTISANTTVTANFTRTANNYTVTANANRGSIASTTGWTGTDTSATKSVTYDSTYGTLPSVSRTGYSFDGWFNNPNKDITLASGTGNYNYTYLLSNAVPGTTYTVKIGTASVTSGSATKFTTYVYDLTAFKTYNGIQSNFGSNVKYNMVVPDDLDPSHDIRLIIYSGQAGSTAGIATKYSNITVSTNDENAIESTTTNKIPGNHDIYAHWTPVEYNITYDLQSGTNASGNPSSYTIESDNITLNNPTRSGYTFDGWTENQDQIKMIDDFDLPYTFEAGSGNSLSSTKLQLLTTSGTYIGQLGGTHTVGHYSSTYTFTGDSGIYTLKYAANGTTADPAVYFRVYMEKGVTYNFEWDLITSTTSQKKVDNFRFYKSTGGNTNVPVKYIYTGSYGDRSYTASWSKAASNLTVTLDTSTYTYNGSAKEPTVTVKDGTTIIPSTEYTVSYSNNTNAGTGVVTVTMKGNYYSGTKAYYTGSTTTNFTINRQGISLPTCTTTYNKQEQTLLSSTTTYTVASSPLKGTNAGSYKVNVTPTSNYKWATDSTTTAKEVTCTINPKSLDQSKFTTGNTSKTYNGNTTSNISLTANSESGVISGDSVTVSYSSATYNNANVASATTINVTGISLSNSNYTVDSTSQSYSGTITRANVTFPTCTAKTYNKQEQTLFEAHTSGQYTNNVLKATNYNADGYTVALTPTANYKWSDNNGTTARNLTCMINKYNINVSSTSISPVSNKIYDGTAYKPTPSVTVALPTSTDTYTLTSSEFDYSYSVAEPTDVNTYTVTMTGKGNYTGSKSATYQITKANGYVNLSANSGSVTYGTASKTFDISSSHGGALSVSDNNATATTEINGNTVTIGNISTLSTGTSIEVTVTSGATNNYNAASATYTLTITNAALTCGNITITGNNVVGEAITASMTSTPAGSYSYQWYKNSSNSTTGGSPITGATSASYTPVASDAGSYLYVTVTATKANYTSCSNSKISNNNSDKVRIKVTKPTAAGYCVNPTYNGSSQTLTDQTKDHTGYVFTGNSATDYNASGYDVVASLEDNYIWSDYSRTNTTINCNITKKTLYVTGKNQSKTYGNANPSLVVGTSTVTYSGQVSGQVPAFTGTLATTAGTTSAVGTYDITAGTIALADGTGGFLAKNYAISYTNGTLTINKKALTPTVSASNKQYDRTTNATCSTSVTLSGVVSGDTVTASASAAGTFDNKNVGTGKTVTCSGITLDGASKNNYSVASSATTTANITAKPLTPTVSASNKQYDRTTDATCSTSVTLSGVVSGDTVTASASSAGTFDNKNVGTGKTVTCSGITLDGADKNNYSVVSSKTTTANITAKPLTPTVSANNKTYDGSATATCSTSVSLSGIITGDTVTATASATGSFADKDAGNSKVVTCSGIALDGADKNNYSVVSNKTTTANITAKTLTVTATSTSRKYGASNPTFAYTYTGNVGTETPGFTGVLATSADSSSNVGTYDITKGTLALAAGTNGFIASNYSMSFVNGTLTVTKADNPIAVTTPQSWTPTYNASSSQTKTFTAASGAQGNVTYSISSQKQGSTDVTYFSIETASSNVLTMAANTPANTYTVKILASAEGNGNYAAGSKEITINVTVGKATNTITLTCATPTYTGSAQNLLSAKSATAGDVYIAIESLTASNYTTKGSTALTGAKGTNAGSYTVYAYTPGNGNYAATSTSKSCSISPATNTTEIAAVTGLKYGQTTSAMVTASTVTGTPYYSVGTQLTSSNYSTGSTTIPTVSSRNAGTYTVYYYIPAGNYEEKSGSVSVTIGKVTPVLTLSSTSGTFNTGDIVTFNEQATVAGKFTNTTSNSSIVSASPVTNSSAVAANTNSQVTLTGVAGGTATITVTFVPTDTTNYNSITGTTYQYSATVRNAVVVTINKNGGAWSNSGKAVKLYQSGTLKYTLTTSGSTASINNVAAGTYDVYATKSSLDSAIVDTGADITITNTDGVISNSSSTVINYYTLTLNKGSNVTTVSGAGDYLSNQSASINATAFATGYHFGSWSKTTGNTPTSTTTASTTVSMSQATTLTANAAANTYYVQFNANNGSGTMSNQTFTYGTAQNLTANAFTRNGYTFVGWNTAANGTGTVYLNSASVNNLTAINNDIVTLYAQWIKNGVATISGINMVGSTLTAGITVEPTPIPDSYTYQWYRGDTLITGATTPTYTPTTTDIGYILKVVITAVYNNYENHTFEDTTDTTINTSSIVMNEVWAENLSYNNTQTGIECTDAQCALDYLNALFEDDLVTVIYDANGGTGSMNQENYYYPGKILTLAPNTFTRTECIFVGWNTKADGTGTAYLDGVSVTLTDTLKLYAQWITNNAMFQDGPTVNAKMKTLASGSTKTYTAIDNNIIAITKANDVPSSWKDVQGNIIAPSDHNIVSVNNFSSITYLPIYMWYDNGTIYWYSEDANPDLNPDSSYLFSNLRGIPTLDVSSFTTGNVTDMSYMFSDISSVTTLNLSTFNTSNVTNMSHMFADGGYTGGNSNSLTTLTFGNNFNTSKVTDMSYMFASSSNPTDGILYTLTSLDLSHFDTSNVVDMSYMFYGGKNSNLVIDVSDFDTGKVENMSNMFRYYSASTEETLLGVENFVTTSVTDMSYMFGNCLNLTKLDLSSWNTSSVTDMSYMFSGDTNLKVIYASNNFSVTGVTNSTSMFSNCTSIVGGAGTDYDSSHIDKTYAHIDGGTSNPGYFRGKTETVRAVDVAFDRTNILTGTTANGVARNNGMSCTETQCALDYIKNMLDGNYKCKRATAAQLHKDTCSQSSGDECDVDVGYGNTITYGKVGTTGTLSPGDAFVCDVNGDGQFNATNEMFYYVSDYYDTTSKEFNNKYATLIFFDDVSGGVTSNNTIPKYDYNSDHYNYLGPTGLVNQLPTVNQWTNVSLYKTSRTILAESYSTHDAVSTSGGLLPTAYSYSGYAARLLTIKELLNACGVSDLGTSNIGILNNCNFLLENTSYAIYKNGEKYYDRGWWLETPDSLSSVKAWIVDSSQRKLLATDVTSEIYGFGGVRPVIEILKSDIKY